MSHATHAAYKFGHVGLPNPPHATRDEKGCQLPISATTMGAATAGQYVYDLELNAGSVVTRLIQGTFQIQAEVTK